MAWTISQSRRHLTLKPDVAGIAGMSRAAALVVTWTAHGLSTGDHVSFAGITTPSNAGEWVALNGVSYPITVVNVNSFSIPVDSHAFTAAYVDANDPGLIGSDFDVCRVQSGQLELGSVVGTFVAGETVTQATSGATGVVFSWQPYRLNLVRTLGTFDATHTITGATSSATGIPNRVDWAYPDGIRLHSIDMGSSQTGDTLIVRDRTASGAIAFPRHLESDDTGYPRSVSGFATRVKPYIKASEQSWGVPANVQIVLEFD
jgi:hypothetical protein